MTVATAQATALGTSHVACDGYSQSTLYTMIPSLVRSRMPVLTSLRQSAKAVVSSSGSDLHRTPSGRRKAYTLSCVESAKEKESFGFAATVPPSGASTPARSASPERAMPSQELSLKVVPQMEARSGVDWDVAATGVRLWVSAKTQADQGGDPMALRSMHVDALRYMHMALPPNLTCLEVDSLRASMSPQLIFPTTPSIRGARRERPPNLLRQGIAQAVCWVFALFLFILPIVMAVLNRLLQFERQHQVTERVLTNGLDMTSALGERGLDLQKALLRFKDGRIGSAFFGLASWFLDGVVGGVNDGIDAVATNRRRAS